MDFLNLCLEAEQLFNFQVGEDELHSVLNQVDLSINGQAEMHEFIQVDQFIATAKNIYIFKRQWRKT